MTIDCVQRFLLIPLLISACAGSLLSLGGCASSAVLAAAGATAGFGLAQGQAEAFIRGELQAARLVPLDQVIAATLEAMKEMQLEVRTLRQGEHDAYIRGRTGNGPEFKVKLQKKSPMITKVNVRVGVMGDMAVSRLVLSSIDRQLGINHLPLLPVEESPIVAPLQVPPAQPGMPDRSRSDAPDLAASSSP